MARCKICDASDQGLSDFRPDGHFHSKKFHWIDDGSYYECDECYHDSEDALAEMYENDLDDEAFNDA